ncbi:MFS transporter [Ruminococcus gauvreauii]|uniref:MFS transporter n=1 Tax=Ruminococcus gauvreauii TaxID=438033 RepID=A0ABY5VD24_9FIRM|nr:MFS transporter [Ruminococcus gauvreauii]UWP58484.1 MFS transporter [Ruminococcus gauvreauii]
MEKTKDSRRWLLLLLMLAAFAVTFMTRFVWSPLNTTVTEELGLSNVAAGSFMSAFFIGYVITQIPGGTLADRFGVKYVLSAGVLVTGLASIGMSFITDYTQGMICRVITGLGAGVVMACCSKVISEYFEQKDRGIAFGILLVGPTVGLTVANKLGARLLVDYSWQAAFRVVGYIAIAIAILIFVTVKNIKSEAIGQKVTLLTGLKIVFTTRNLVCVCFAGFFYMFLNLGVSTWANTYLGSIGYETVQAAGVMSIYSIGGIIGSLLTGIIVKKFNMNVKFYLIGVYILIAVVTLIFGFQTNLGILKAAGFVYGFATYLPNAHLNALITKYAPDHLAGSVMGVQNCIFQMASILSPMVVGWTVDLTGTFRTCWFALAVMPVIGLAFLFILREQRGRI